MSKTLRRVSKPHVRSDDHHASRGVRCLWAWTTNSRTGYKICGYLSGRWERCQECGDRGAHYEFLQFHSISFPSTSSTSPFSALRRVVPMTVSVILRNKERPSDL